jgi:hypothetical protein
MLKNKANFTHILLKSFVNIFLSSFQLSYNFIAEIFSRSDFEKDFRENHIIYSEIYYLDKITLLIQNFSFGYDN